MDSSRVPCAQPDADPNDWFIDRHGQQYSDIPWLSRDEKEKLEAAMAEQGMSRLQQISGVARTEARRKREALIARRHAKEACYECPIRTSCLEGALERREPRGTWGGLYEEEIQTLIRGGRRRERKKRAQEELASQNPESQARIPA